MRTTKTYSFDAGIQDQFRITCILLGLNQSKVLEDFMKEFIIKNKYLANEMLIQKQEDIDQAVINANTKKTKC